MAHPPRFIIIEEEPESQHEWDQNDRIRALGDRVQRSIQNTDEIVRRTRLLMKQARRLKEDSRQILIKTTQIG